MSRLTNLAWNNVKKDKSRSILVTISIILTTLLLTVIATFGYGLINLNRINAPIWYGSYYGIYSNITEENINQMEMRSEFTDIGKIATLGKVESDKSLYLCYADEMAAQMTNMDKTPINGSYPKNINEIAAQSGFFKLLGINNPQVGDLVTISYRINLNTPYIPDTFIISGLIEEKSEDLINEGYTAYISQEYYELNIPKEDRIYRAYFRIDDSIKITSYNGKSKMEELAVKCKIDERYVTDNYAYLMWALDPGTETIIGCAVIAAVVVLFSVIVIYNIFHVGIVRKVQEYGKLKAIGATKKQMKKVILLEGIYLGVIGIPIGVLTGYIVSVISFNWLIKLANSLNKSMEKSNISLFSPGILLLASFLAFITVYIALRKPMKIVASVSAIEAMRYREKVSKEKGIRKGRQSLSVVSMTMANLSAHRKRTVSTILSMGLSCILFIILTNILGNMNPVYTARESVEYGQFKISLDYSLKDIVYPENNLNNILRNNPFDKEFIDKIKEIEGVDDVITENILYSEKIDDAGNKTEEILTITILSKESFAKKLKEGGSLGTFDYEKVSKENGIIYGWRYFMSDYGYYIGQTVDLLIHDDEKQVLFSGNIMGSFGNADGDMVITEDTFYSFQLKGNMTNIVWIDCTETNLQKVEEGLNELLMGMEHLDMNKYQDALSNAKASIRMTKSGGYLLCILIGFISFMNMANTVITSITSRKQEFGILQAIGMTNSQLSRSLQMEGIFFTLGTVIVSLIIGIPVGYGFFFYGKSHGFIGLNVYQFPIFEILLMILVLAVLQMILSFILSRNIKRESLVERIRYQE